MIKITIKSEPLGELQELQPMGAHCKLEMEGTKIELVAELVTFLDCMQDKAPDLWEAAIEAKLSGKVTHL